MPSSPLPSADDDGKFSNFTAEKCKRIMEEVNRLARLAPGEWRIWIDASAKRFHISRETLETLIDDTITANEKAAKEKAVADRRSSQMADRAQKAEDKKKERNEAKKQTAAEAKAGREQREVEKEAERKSKISRRASAICSSCQSTATPMRWPNWLSGWVKTRRRCFRSSKSSPASPMDFRRRAMVTPSRGLNPSISPNFCKPSM